MISIIIPTIRPEKIPNLLKTLDFDIQFFKERSIDVEVIWEVDHEHIGAPKMVKRLTDKSKGEWVVFLGDDTIVSPHCIIDAYILAISADKWLVGFNDGHGQKATHWLAHKKLLDHLENREFFYTGYIHNFCDDELRVRATRLGKYLWCEEARIIHSHPAFGTATMDDTYKVQTDRIAWDHDEKLFNQRMNESKPTLGIVMIVKNESAVLAQCLESVKDADALFIADTGSTDNTIEVIKNSNFNGNINIFMDFKWNDSFADARNFIKGKATTDWLLSIDADEVLDEGGIAEIKKIIAYASPNELTVNIQLKSNRDSYHVPRLFRNDPRVEWVGSIHETVNHLALNNHSVGITYGSSPAHALDPDRNIRILEKSYEREPKNTRTLYYLGREYAYRQEWVKAEKILEERVSEDGYLAEKADAYFILAFCYWHDGRANGEKARQSCLMALNINANFKAAIMLMAEMSFEKNAAQWKRLAATANNEDSLFAREQCSSI